MFSGKKNPQKNRMYGETQQNRNGSNPDSFLLQDLDSYSFSRKVNYLCKQCNKAFSHSSNLKKHVNTIHLELKERSKRSKRRPKRYDD